MNGHLDLDALADLLAGEGGDRQVDHVAACPACSAALVELEDAGAQVSAALAALPPPPVPADLPARLEAALREAAPLPEAPDEPAPPALRLLPLGPLSDEEDDDRVRPAARPHTRQGTRRRRPVLLGAAAAAVAVALGGAALTATLPGGPDAQSATAGASGGTEREEAGVAAPAAPQLASGRSYGPGRRGLAAALPALLEPPAPTRAAAGSPPGLAPDADDGLRRLREPAALAACLAALPAAPGEPLALDYATYDGRPALLVVRPAADPARVEVAVVGPGCRAGAPDELLRTTLPRPS